MDPLFPINGHFAVELMALAGSTDEVAAMSGMSSDELVRIMDSDPTLMVAPGMPAFYAEPIDEGEILWRL